MPFKIPFDINEASKTNLLIAGGNASGKTLLACRICDILATQKNARIVVFDSTNVAWIQKSNIPYYDIMKHINDTIHINNESMIIGLGMLIPSECRTVVNQICAELWRQQLTDHSRPLYIVLEEAQTYLKESKETISILRHWFSGRNINSRCMAITCDISRIPTPVLRLARQKYLGFHEREENILRKLRNTWGKDTTRILVEGLDVGDFIYINGNQRKVFHAPLFQRTVIPQPIYRKPAKKKGLFQRIREALYLKTSDFEDYETETEPDDWEQQDDELLEEEPDWLDEPDEEEPFGI